MIVLGLQPFYKAFNPSKRLSQKAESIEMAVPEQD
jgi:hypothetical protein